MGGVLVGSRKRLPCRPICHLAAPPVTFRGLDQACLIHSLNAGCESGDQANPSAKRTPAYEYVALILANQKRSELEQAIRAGFDLFVPVTVADPGERDRLSRLVGVVLASPFLITLAGITATTEQSAVAMLVGICLVFAISLSIALFIAATGRGNTAAGIALVAGSMAGGLLIATGGGLASPLAALLVALPLEAYRIGRSRIALVWGSVAALAALTLQIPVAAFQGTALIEVSAWQWLAPLVYVATLVLRMSSGRSQAGAGEAARLGLAVMKNMRGALLRIAPNGDVVDASVQAENVLGLAPELVEGRGLFERLRIPDRVAYRCAISECSQGGSARLLEVTLRVPGRDGESPAGVNRLFELEIMPGTEADGCAIAILRPADAVAHLRNELEKAEEVAGSTEMTKTRFLATVSHELRTPLNAIIGFSEMMLHEAVSGPLDTKQKEHVGLIRDAGRHLLSVVNSILDVSKIEAGAYQLHPEPFDFATTATLGLSLLEPQAVSKGLNLSSSVSAGIGEVCGDQRAIQQILINLLSNAIKFTPQGGQVSLEACLDQGHLRISVADTGIGMSREELARVGQPFTQVSNDYTRNFEGSGLGLCLVRGLVELQEGAMTIESAPGQGTVVTVTLPVSNELKQNNDREAGIGSGEKGELKAIGEGHEAARRIA
jgi:cell cycle sensor histidine kinase DivJ